MGSGGSPISAQVELELERQKAEDVGGQVTVGVESPVYDVGLSENVGLIPPMK